MFALFSNRCDNLPRYGGRKGFGFDSAQWEEKMLFILGLDPPVDITAALLKKVGRHKLLSF